MKSLSRFLAIRLMSTLSDQLLLFVVPLLVYQATGSISMSGLAFFIEWLPRVISLPFAGVFSDFFGGQRVYIFADAARACICFLGFSLVMILPKEYTFYVVSVLMGLCAICYAQAFIAQETTIPAMIKSEDIHKAQSMVQSIEQTSVVFGPMIAAIFSYYLPLKYLLLIAGLVFLISFIGMYFMNALTDATKINKNNKKMQVADIWQGLLIVRNSRKLIWLCILTISVNLLWGLALATGAAMITGFYSQSTTIFGFIQTAVGVLSVMVLLLAPFLIQRLSLTSFGLLAYGLIIVAGLMIGYNHHYYSFVIGYALILMLDGVFNIYIRTERVKIIPKEHLGKTIGVIVLINQLSVPIAGLFVATYSKTLGVHNLYLMVSLLASILLLMQIGYRLISARNDVNSKKILLAEQNFKA